MSDNRNVEFSVPEVKSLYEKYKSNWLLESEINTMIATLQRVNTKNNPALESDKLHDVQVLQDLISSLEKVTDSTKQNLEMLKSWIWKNNVEQKNSLNKTKENYETLQQHEIDQISSAIKVAMSSISALDWYKFSVKNQNEIFDFLDSLKVGQKIYTWEKNKNWTSKTIFDKVFNVFHDAQQVSDDKFDKQAQDIVNKLWDQIDEILWRESINWPRTIDGWIQGYKIENWSKLSKKLDEIFSTQNNIEWKTRKDIEDAIIAWKAITIEINTDKDWKKTYKYSQKDSTTSQGNLSIKETKTTAWETKLTADTQKFVNTLKFPIGEYKTKADFENALKSNKPITLEKQKDWTYKTIDSTQSSWLLVVVPWTPAIAWTDKIPGKPATPDQVWEAVSNMVQTEVLTSSETVYSFESQYFSKLNWAIDSKWNIDWKKLWIDWKGIQNYKQLKNSDKSLVITIDWKWNVSYSIDKRAYSPIYVKKLDEKTTSTTSFERLTLNWRWWSKIDAYTNWNSDFEKLVRSEKFVKHMQTINNTIPYRDFIKLAQSWDYERAANAVVEKLKVPWITKAMIDQLTSADKRKLVDDTIEAAFGDESMVKNHFEIKLKHLAENWLWHLSDDYNLLKQKFLVQKTENQISGLLTVLSLRNLQNKEKTIIQRGFTTHTEVFGLESSTFISKEEFSKTKTEFLKTVQLTDEMKKNYLLSRGLEISNNDEAKKAWNVLISGQTFEYKWNKYSIDPKSENLKTFLVWVCQNMGLKYEFELRVQKTNTTSKSNTEYIPLRDKEETRTIGKPWTINNQAQVNFTIPWEPGTPDTPWTPWIPETPRSEISYPVEQTPGTTTTTDTLNPTPIPATPETITPPDTTPGITIEHQSPIVPEKPDIPDVPESTSPNTTPDKPTEVPAPTPTTPTVPIGPNPTPETQPTTPLPTPTSPVPTSPGK